MARRICNSTDEGDTFHASLYERDAFASFDLSVLTRKQLDVIAMRYCGMLSWRRIAAFEGVTHRAVRKRHALALSKLKSQKVHTLRISRGTNCVSWSAADATHAVDAATVPQSGAAHVVSEGGGHGIVTLSWEALYQQEEEEAAAEASQECAESC